MNELTAKKLLSSCKDLICAVNLARQEQHIRSFGDDLRSDIYDSTADEIAAKIATIIDEARIAIKEAE